MDEEQISQVAEELSKKGKRRVEPKQIIEYLKERLVADDTVKAAQGARDGIRAKYSELGVPVEDVDRMCKAVIEINKIVTPQEHIGTLMQAVSKGLGFATDADADYEGG